MKKFTDDNEVLIALSSGDNFAFEHVYSLYFKRLCYFAERLTGDAVIAQDMVSESFVKLLQKKPEFPAMDNLKSFLYTSTRNNCFDHLRMEKRHNLSHKEIRYRTEMAEDEIEGNMILAEVLQAVYAAIENLPQKYKKVVKLALVEGLNNDEIAHETGMAYQTVRNHKSEGIKLLKISLFKNGELTHSGLIYCLLWLAQQ